ncbi:hypothetical protein Tco_1097972 [Tanacetum coccineum]
MPYPRFTKVIINHFISKDKTISMRNKINLHTIRDDSLLDIKDSQAYKTYYNFATGKVPPRKARKYKKVASPSRKLSPVKEAEPVKKAKRVKRPAKKSTTAPTAGVVIKDTPGVFVSKKKTPTKGDKGKGMKLLSDATLLEAAQVKEALQKSKKDSHMLHASGSDDGVGSQPKGDSEYDNDDINDDDDDNDNNDDDSESKDDDEHDEEYEYDDDSKNVFEEEDDDLYKDVDVRSLGAEHEKERKGDEEMTDKTESSKQSSSVSSDFASKFLILDNVPPVVDEVASMRNVNNHQEESSTQAPSLFTLPGTVIPKTSTAHATTVPLTISLITPLPQLTTPSPAPTTVPTTTSIPALPDFSSLFRFDQRVSTLETELYATRTALHSYTKEFEKKAQEERKLYIDVVEKSVKDIIKDEVKSLLPEILPKEVSDFATPVIQTESLTEFELKKILLEKMERSESYKLLLNTKNYMKDWSNLTNVYSLKRDRDDKDKDKDEDPSAGSDRGLKKQKMSKDAEPPKG